MSLRASGRSAGSPAVRRAAAWLARQQNDDGGFSYATRGGGSFVDETGAALQGLAAAGRAPRRGWSHRALAYLRARPEPGRRIRPVRGLPLERAVDRRGRCRASSRPAARRPRSAATAARRWRYLATLQQADGSFRYSRSSTQTPVWVTAQVVAALRRKTFPVKSRPRKRVEDGGSPPATPKRKGQGGEGEAPSRSARVSDAEGQTTERTTDAGQHARPVATHNAAEPDDERLPATDIPVGAAVAVAGATGAYVLRRTRR